MRSSLSGFPASDPENAARFPDRHSIAIVAVRLPGQRPGKTLHVFLIDILLRSSLSGFPASDPENAARFPDRYFITIVAVGQRSRETLHLFLIQLYHRSAQSARGACALLRRFQPQDQLVKYTSSSSGGAAGSRFSSMRMSASRPCSGLNEASAFAVRKIQSFAPGILS